MSIPSCASPGTPRQPYYHTRPISRSKSAFSSPTPPVLKCGTAELEIGSCDFTATAHQELPRTALHAWFQGCVSTPRRVPHQTIYAAGGGLSTTSCILAVDALYFLCMNSALPRQRAKRTEPYEVFGWRCYCNRCGKWFLHLCDEDVVMTDDGRECCKLPPRCAYRDCASPYWLTKPRRVRG
jgi:hypothetical protein